MENIQRPMIETYELTLRHYGMVNGHRIQIEEPMTYQANACVGEAEYAHGYKNHLIDELFYRLRKEVLNGRDKHRDYS